MTDVSASSASVINVYFLTRAGVAQTLHHGSSDVDIRKVRHKSCRLTVGLIIN